MIKILKHIFGKNNRSIALFAEIVIVTIIGWLILEPITVNTTTAMIPAGYDHNRLVMLTIASLDEKSAEYDKSIKNEDKEKSFDNLLRMVRERQGVEKATYTFYQSFEMNGRTTNNLQADSTFKKKGIEDLNFSTTCINFLPNTDFFTTFGIKDATGKDFQEPETDKNSYIVSKSMAKAVFPNESPLGKDLFPPSEWRPKSTIVGVTADMPYVKGDGRIGTYYIPIQMNFKYGITPHAIVMRLGENVNPRIFIEKLTSDLSGYHSGNLYLTHPVYMSDLREEIFAEKQRELTQKWIIVAFFLVNVLLAVAGTFYVQCKTRIPDAGVMRAFGAPRKRIIWNIVGDALLTTFIAWLIGSLIYIIYLKVQGFPMETDTAPIIRYLRPLWQDTKLGRYSIIGGIILLFLLATSALGAWLPARKVGRVPIVDSLRDE